MEHAVENFLKNSTLCEIKVMLNGLGIVASGKKPVLKARLVEAIINLGPENRKIFMERYEAIENDLPDDAMIIQYHRMASMKIQMIWTRNPRLWISS